MDFDLILQLLLGYLPAAKLILEFLGLLVIVGQGVVLLTPSKKDDEFEIALLSKPIVGPLLKSLMKFAPIQKK
ncbi:MAG TPA: hypothetical protein VMZ26_13385 [Pyrinomonadaceae bacterium]|nr:hypothetical protein [Pyrinomonadaceae bacterium]